MINTVIGELYTSFDKRELRLFDLYISTSNWQYSETIVKCHECLLNALREGVLEELKKESIFSHIYDEEKYNDSKLRFVFNRLIDSIKEFIIVQQNKEGSVFTQKIWLDFLVQKKLKKNLQYNIEKQSNSTTSEYKFLSSYFKSQEESFQLFNFSKDTKAQYLSIAEVMTQAEVFSDLVFIKNYCSLISFTNVYQSIPFELPNDKLNEIKHKKWGEKYPEFAVYMSLINLLINKDILAYYYEFKELLFNNFEIWEDEEKVNFMTYILNFTTNQINKGVVNFIDEQYDLYRYFEENGVFQIQSFIDPGRINNVIYIYLRKKEFKKAEDFVLKYTPKLENELESSCKHFNLARILFENQKHKECLKELLQVDFSQDAFYSLNSKLLLLKNYFELKESDAFDSLCLSFKEYIRKNKIVSINHKTYYLNFIKAIKKLYQSTPSRLKALNKSIVNQKQIAEKNWLLEKTQIAKGL